MWKKYTHFSELNTKPQLIKYEQHLKVPRRYISTQQHKFKLITENHIKAQISSNN